MSAAAVAAPTAPPAEDVVRRCYLCRRHPTDGPYADLCDRCKTIHEDELADRHAEALAELSGDD
ncbi:hypothetical protein [Aeromicrobium sp. Leaf291]|uniref:hypothetical protein n=1 Tax=Aeromicrobium sp. Leaf291 TaxID=1736325 RepID=UPI0012E0CA51|nr:hypothetical protein [Aeromicrobium sp. Leaf291]